MNLQLEEEGGVTSVSLSNAAKLIAAYGKPVQVVLEDDPKDGHTVTAFWPGERSFKFTGFSWGYGGTGPHGLERFFEMAGIVCGIKTIMSWPEKGLKKTI
jgi:hypothetical protein